MHCGLNLEKVQHVFSSDQDSRLTSEEVASHNLEQAALRSGVI